MRENRHACDVKSLLRKMPGPLHMADSNEEKTGVLIFGNWFILTLHLFFVYELNNAAFCHALLLIAYASSCMATILYVAHQIFYTSIFFFLQAHPDLYISWRSNFYFFTFVLHFNSDNFS